MTLFYEIQYTKNRQFKRHYSPRSILKECLIDDIVIIEVKGEHIIGIKQHSI